MSNVWIEVICLRGSLACGLHDLTNLPRGPEGATLALACSWQNPILDLNKSKTSVTKIPGQKRTLAIHLTSMLLCQTCLCMSYLSLHDQVVAVFYIT